MKFHFISEADRQMSISEIAFGASLKSLHIGHVRAVYVIIDKGEFEDTMMTEQQMMRYFTDLKKSLDFGGKIYLEATPF